MIAHLLPLLLGDPEVTVELLGPRFEATVEEPRRAALDEAFDLGLARAGVEGTPFTVAGSCGREDDACWDSVLQPATSRYVLVVDVRVSERRYTADAVLRDSESGAMVAESVEVCEVCSVGEAAEMLERQGAVLAARVVELATAPSTISISTEPDGARVSVDGEPVGTTPVSIELSPGRHTIKLSAADYAPRTLDVDLLPSVRERLEVSLSPRPVVPQPAAPTEFVEAPDRLRLPGALATGGGAVAVVLGAIGVGIDGFPYRARCSGTDRDAGGNCRFLFNTRTAGAVTLAIGTAALTTGITLLALSARRRR